MLFDDPGAKLIRFAKIFFAVGVFASLVLGLFLLAQDQIVPGILVWLAGPVSSYMMALALAAFGDLVENTELNWITTRAILEKLESRKEKTGRNKSPSKQSP